MRVYLCICVEMLHPPMCEENILIEISLNEERQIMFLYDRLTERVSDKPTATYDLLLSDLRRGDTWFSE